MERGPNGDADDDTECSDAMMSPMSSEARKKIALKEPQKEVRSFVPHSDRQAAIRPLAQRLILSIRLNSIICRGS